MNDYETHQAKQIDAYLDALIRNIDAPPPVDLEPDTVNLLHDLVSTQHAPDDNALMKRVWIRALFDAHDSQSVKPSLNGSPTKKNLQETAMTNLTASTFDSKRPRSYRLPTTVAVATLVTVFFVTVLISFGSLPGNTTHSNATGLTPLQEQADEEIDIEALFNRYLNDVMQNGHISEIDTILSPEHSLFILHDNRTTNLNETLDFLLELSELIEHIDIIDTITDENSIWARLDISIEVDGSSKSAIIVAYVDRDTGVFTETHLAIASFGLELMLLRQQNVDSGQRRIDAFRRENNISIAQQAIEIFWSQSSSLNESDLEMLATLYEPDYQLHVNDETRTVLQAQDDRPLTEFLQVVRANLRAINPQIHLTEFIDIYASGNYVFADVTLQSTVNEEARTVMVSFVYRVVDDVIVEEWWSSDIDLLQFATADD